MSKIVCSTMVVNIYFGFLYPLFVLHKGENVHDSGFVAQIVRSIKVKIHHKNTDASKKGVKFLTTSSQS